MFAGDEPETYVADAANFIPIVQGDLFDRFPVLDSGLEGPVGTTMVWNDATLEFAAAPALPS